MCRLLRVPSSLAKVFRPLPGQFHWNHGTSFRLLVLAMAVMWGRRNVAHVSRYLDAAPHRTRFNNFFLVERGAPEAARRQQAQVLVRGLPPGKGDLRSLMRDDAKKAKRGPGMEAVAQRNDAVTAASSRGHQDVGAMVVCRTQVLPWGIPLQRTPEQAPSLGLPFRKPTALAAQRIRAFKAPAGVKVVVLLDAYDLCRTVGQAGREPPCHCASTRKSHRSLFTPGWQLKAGRQGRNLWRRRRPEPLVIAKPPGKARDRGVDAGWLEVSHLGRLPGVFSRQGSARKIRGLVTDAPALSAAHLIQPDERRGTIEPWVKDLKPLLGLGPSQNRPYRAAVTPLHLVCVAYALLTHLRIERLGAPGHRTRDKAADLSTAAVQAQLRSLLWEDLITDLKEERHGQPVIEELERLRVA